MNRSKLLLCSCSRWPRNCFKHGIGKNPGKISIHIKFDGRQLIFKTENTIALREKTPTEKEWQDRHKKRWKKVKFDLSWKSFTWISGWKRSFRAWVENWTLNRLKDQISEWLEVEISVPDTRISGPILEFGIWNSTDYELHHHRRRTCRPSYPGASHRPLPPGWRVPERFEMHSLHRNLSIKNAVDLMFLDINLPEMSGVSFLRSLIHPPLVIFYHSLPANMPLMVFDLEIVDFLLKPFSFERFCKAVNKAKDRLNVNSAPSAPGKNHRKIRSKNLPDRHLRYPVYWILRRLCFHSLYG